MTSEPISKNPEDESRYEWVTPREAAVRENVSEKTVYNRINSGFYTSRDTGKSKEIRLLKPTGEPSKTTVNTEATSKPTEVASNVSEEFQNKLLKEKEERIQDLRSQIQNLQDQLQTKDDQIKQFNEIVAQLTKSQEENINLLKTTFVLGGKTEIAPIDLTPVYAAKKPGRLTRLKNAITDAFKP